MDVLPKEKKEWPYREKQSENGNVVFFYCFIFRQYKSFLLLY